MESLYNSAIWLVILFFIGLISLPINLTLLRFSNDFGFGISKVLGLLLVGCFIWATSLLLPLPLSPIRVKIIFSGFLFFSLTATLYLRKKIRPDLKNIIKELFYAELIFFLAFVAIAINLAFHPEIYWGEKPMDLSFIRYFNRLTNFPAEEPWAAGMPLKYYYFGYYFWGLVHKLSGVDPRFGYNLSVASAAGLFASTLYSILTTLTKKRIFAFFGALFLAVFSANLELFRLVLSGSDVYSSPAKNSFDLFWATTRFFTSPAFTEFPIWSYLFADLHPHMIAPPFSMAFLFLLIPLIGGAGIKFSSITLGRLLLAGLSLGALMAINVWDFLFYSTLTLVIILFRPLPKLNIRSIGRVFIRAIRDIFFISLAASPILLPFFIKVRGDSLPGLGFVTAPEFNRFWQAFSAFGQFVAPLMVLAMIQIFFAAKNKFKAVVKMSLALIISSLAFLLSRIEIFIRASEKTPLLNPPNFEIACFAALIIFFGTLWLVITDRSYLRSFFSGILLISLGSTIILAEQLYLFDRMNTIFKIYYIVYPLLGIATLVGLQKLLIASREKDFLFRYASSALYTAPLFLSFAGAISLMVLMARFQRVAGPRPTLDGEAYYAQYSPNDNAIVQYLNKMVQGVPVIAEAFGGSYGDFTRITMHTGLPTVLGWEYHLVQRGVSRDEINKRQNDLRLLYQTSFIDQAVEIIKNYKINYLVFSGLERATYGDQGLRLFLDFPNIFEVVWSENSSYLFKIKL
ncbi:MAG TPA: DUF2298 domain-containing protein [Oligoflexia bacterium]|nr:DUF2298 domain-containing protein [Oligoflexia bacterium]HMP26924.1 DUF2298 domain-containing protein [Oligoflexia bacterium]